MFCDNVHIYEFTILNRYKHNKYNNSFLSSILNSIDPTFEYMLNKKDVISIEDSKNNITSLLDDIQLGLFQQAKTFLDSNTTFVQTYTDFKSIIKK